MDGFEVLEKVPSEKLPLVIFTTAYDQHALQAFEAHALDYLLKPINADRYKVAINRAYDHFEAHQTRRVAQGLLGLLADRQGAPEAKRGNRFLSRLTVKIDDKVLVLRTADIEYIESAGNYVAVHVATESHILRETLNGLEKQLDPDKFLRISRSVLVNLNYVRELQPMFKGESVVVLERGTQIPVTRGIREVEKALRFC